MFIPFFTQAALSASGQQAFRRAVAIHLCALAGGVWAVHAAGGTYAAAALLGSLLLVIGIVEGAILLGWRLTQLPRSQALEFLLVSPLHPRRVFLAEALVGLARLALVTMCGLPVLVLLAATRLLLPSTILPLLIMPWTWGAIVGFGLVVWAYEPASVRRWAERVIFALVLVYLGAGVLGAERLMAWGSQLPQGVLGLLRQLFDGFFEYNPFAVLRDCHRLGMGKVWRLIAGVELLSLALLLLLALRAACRLLGHFHERHYQPAVDRSARPRPPVGERPLAWWAVKRVSHYSGRINLWLAGGFGVLYALYTVAGPSWPDWLGSSIFQLCDREGGIPALATGLVLLAAVPAAFQYGLWDSSEQDRCRRLELLLLTELQARDYWDAAAAAAWQRGRGYLFIAVQLWGSALASGQASSVQTADALAAGVVLWCLYFALGFRAFSRGRQANGLGLLLTLGVPLLAFVGYRGHLGLLTELLPPASVYSAAAGAPGLVWALGPILAAITTLALGRFARTHCEPELRRWYELHHGRKLLT
jgi:hypothetical protein